MVTMELTYYGHSCFKVKTKDLVLVIDPFDPNKLGIKLPKLEADVLLLTHDHFDHSYKAGVSGYRLLIDGPGEYELSGVDIVGIPVDHDEEHGSVRGKNTILSRKEFQFCIAGIWVMSLMMPPWQSLVK